MLRNDLFLGQFLSAALFIFVIALSCAEDDGPGSSNNNDPSQFDLISINDNADEIILTLYLTWESAVDPDGDQVKYDLIMDKTGDLTTSGESIPSTVVQSDIGTNAFTLIDALLPQTEYSWCIVARDDNGGSTKSISVFSFKTADYGTGNLFPGNFDLLAPADGASDVSLAPGLSWQASVDPDGDLVVYDVYLDQNTTPNTQISQGISALTTTPISLNRETKYYWRVVARDSNGAATKSSSTFSFTTKGDDPPSGALLKILTQNGIQNESGRYGHQAVVFNGSLLVLGGWAGKEGDPGNKNDVWSTTDGVNWTEVRGHDFYNGFHSTTESEVLVYNNLLYVFNGTRNTIQTSANGADWETVSWTGMVSEGTHYSPRQGHQAIVFNNNLLVIGGSSGGQVSDDVWQSTDGGISWAEISGTSFTPVRDHQSFEFNGKIWVVGGLSNGLRSNDIWSSSDGISWVLETASPNFPERTNHECTVFNDKIILTGGDGPGGDLADMWTSTDGINWEEVAVPDGFERRQEHQTVVFDNSLYLMFGKSTVTPLNDVWWIEM